jgi:hypothetical protein
MVDTIAVMARPKKADEVKRVTEQVRLETHFMYMVRLLAAEEKMDAPLWIEKTLAPIVNRLYDAMPERLAAKNKARRKPPAD